MKRHLLFWFFIVIFSSKGFSQKSKNIIDSSTFFDQQIELRHDNDFLLYTDRYYTAGSFIEYRKLLAVDTSTSRKEQITIGLEHLLYTPTNITSLNIADFDRPYAGYLGINTGTFIANKSYAATFKISLGVTGPISMAGDFQTLFHNKGGVTIPAWTPQIKNNLHINFYIGYIKEWKLNPEAFSVYASIHPKIAFGTYTTHVDQEFKFFFGKRNKFLKSMAYNMLGATKKEFFFSVNFTYRYVLHNAVLEGHLVGDDSMFLVDAYPQIFLFGTEGYYRGDRNDIKIGYQYISKESRNTDVHSYVVLSIARRF